MPLQMLLPCPKCRCGFSVAVQIDPPPQETQTAVCPHCMAMLGLNVAVYVQTYIPADVVAKILKDMPVPVVEEPKDGKVRVH